MVEIRWEGGGRRADLVFGGGGRVQEVSGGEGPLHIKYLVPGYQWRTWPWCATSMHLTHGATLTGAPLVTCPIYVMKY